MSIFRQTPDGDIDLSSGTLVVERDPDKETATRLANRFRCIRGEWRFDTRVGVPYFERIFAVETKRSLQDVALVASLIQRVAEETPGVVSAEVSVTVDAATRRMNAQITARSQTGELTPGQIVGREFIVEV